MNHRGFTLIELMIVVAVVGILAAIAYPSYQEQVRKSRRADGAAVLMQNAQFLERFFTENGRYDQDRGGTAVALPYATSPLDGDATYYNISLNSVTTRPNGIHPSCRSRRPAGRRQVRHPDADPRRAHKTWHRPRPESRARTAGRLTTGQPSPKAYLWVCSFCPPDGHCTWSSMIPEMLTLAVCLPASMRGGIGAVSSSAIGAAASPR